MLLNRIPSKPLCLPASQLPGLQASKHHSFKALRLLYRIPKPVCFLFDWDDLNEHNEHDVMTSNQPHAFSLTCPQGIKKPLCALRAFAVQFFGEDERSGFNQGLPCSIFEETSAADLTRACPVQFSKKRAKRI